MTSVTTASPGSGAPPASAKRRRPSRIHGNRFLPYILIGPAVVYLVIFQGYPLLQEVWLSMTRTNLLNPNRNEFIGADNFVKIFTDPRFMNTLSITVIYVIVCVAGIVAVGLGVALLMDRDFPGRGVARSLVIIPWAAPSVAVALIQVWMFNGQYGVINKMLEPFGLVPPGGVWLDNPDLALPVVLAVTIWQLFPFTAVVILAALQAVPEELREAALLDGAGIWTRFKEVTWPVISPTVGLMALLVTIWSIRRFELIWLMTQGGPVGATNTIVIDLYRRGFINNQLGESAAVGIVGLVISLTITIVYFMVANRQQKGA